MRSQEVNSAISSFARPWGFGKRTSYDYKSKWGKGFIWIREQGGLDTDDKNQPIPDWSLQGSIEGIILHELGHAYGLGHVQGTIMRSDIAKILQNLWINNPELRQKFTTEIDQENQLYSRPFGTTINRGNLGVAIYDRSQKYDQSFFFLLTGRKAEGDVSAQATRVGLDAINLEIKDSRGTYKLKLDPVRGSLVNACGNQTLLMFWRIQTLDLPQDQPSAIRTARN